MLKVVESMDNYLQRMLLPRLANQLHSVDYDTAQWISSNVLPIKTLQKEFHRKSIDCLKINPHPTHFNLEQSINLSKELKPKKTILTNLHTDLDYEILKKSLPKGIVPAYDGMKFKV